MPLFHKPEHMQKIKFNFESFSIDNKNIVGIKTIKSFFSSLGLYNDLFINDLYYYFPELSSRQKQNDFKMSFEDCISLIDFLISKKNCPKHNKNLLQSFKLFDKGGNGVVNAGDLLPVMKKYLSPKEFQQYSQIITTSFGPTINYLDVFKIQTGKNA